TKTDTHLHPAKQPQQAVNYRAGTPLKTGYDGGGGGSSFGGGSTFSRHRALQMAGCALPIQWPSACARSVQARASRVRSLLPITKKVVRTPRRASTSSTRGVTDGS